MKKIFRMMESFWYTMKKLKKKNFNQGDILPIPPKQRIILLQNETSRNIQPKSMSGKNVRISAAVRTVKT